MDQPTRTFARIRRINEELAAEARRDDLGSASVPFLCECSRDGCFQPVWTRLDEYAAARERGRRLLASGHGVEDEGLVAAGTV